MSLLLDTHVFLWFVANDARLPAGWDNWIRDPANSVCLSVASVWEAVIKQQIGKLHLPKPAEVYLPTHRQRHLIDSLPIDETSIAHLAKLPTLHRDPFDRMLVAQAQQHNLTIATVDRMVMAYPVKTLP